MYANLRSDRTIDLQLEASSASELETQVREDEAAVVVSVVRTNPPAPGEPERSDITSTRIELETPLGDRPLRDAATGREVPFRSADDPS